jgi:hypothetical protein
VVLRDMKGMDFWIGGLSGLGGFRIFEREKETLDQ